VFGELDWVRDRIEKVTTRAICRAVIVIAALSSCVFRYGSLILRGRAPIGKQAALLGSPLGESHRAAWTQPLYEPREGAEV